MTRVWKPGQLLRFGFPIRAGADEALQFVGRVGVVDYLNKAVLEKWAGIKDAEGRLLLDEFGRAIRAPQGAMKPIRSPLHAMNHLFGGTDEALDDGVLTEAELRDLENLRIDLGLGKHTASQIIDAGVVEAALHNGPRAALCPHCKHALP